MRRAWLIPSLVCAVLTAPPLEAQWQVTADAGLARLRQSGIPESNAPTLGVAASTVGDRWGLGSSVLTARTAADRWTAQGIALGSVRSDAFAGRQWDVTGSVSNFSASNERPTIASEIMAQARFGTNDRGSALGFGGGVLAHYGTSSLGQMQGGIWQSIAHDRFLGEGSLVVTRSAAYLSNGAIGLEPISYADFSGSWRREYSAVSFGAVAGLRAGINGVAGADGWASADATVWFAPQAAIVASAGRTLDDAVRGIPRTRYVSLAIRLAARPRIAVAQAAQRLVMGARVTVELLDDGRRRIDVRGVNGMRIELMADFTDWNAVVLDRVGDAWRVEQAVSPGPHRIALRVDGGEWIAPANVPHVTDDLGGVVGLITIP